VRPPGGKRSSQTIRGEVAEGCNRPDRARHGKRVVEGKEEKTNRNPSRRIEKRFRMPEQSQNGFLYYAQEEGDSGSISNGAVTGKREGKRKWRSQEKSRAQARRDMSRKRQGEDRLISRPKN